MDVRHSQLVLIEKKIETANDKINDILQKLGWTREELITWHNVNYTPSLRCIRGDSEA